MPVQTKPATVVAVAGPTNIALTGGNAVAFSIGDDHVSCIVTLESFLPVLPPITTAGATMTPGFPRHDADDTFDRVSPLPRWVDQSWKVDVWYPTSTTRCRLLTREFPGSVLVTHTTTITDSGAVETSWGVDLPSGEEMDDHYQAGDMDAWLDQITTGIAQAKTLLADARLTTTTTVGGLR